MAAPANRAAGRPATSKPFRFQRFSVADDRCAMKVGTDGILLGSWTPIERAQRVLDVGTGSGLIALMLAQRSEAMESRVDAIEVDQAAAEQARKNIAASPWADRVSSRNISFQDFSIEQRHHEPYSLIVSNPPYFEPHRASSVNATGSGGQRATARQTGALTHAELLGGVKDLLADHGLLSVVIPFQQTGAFKSQAMEVGLFRHRECNVRALVGGQPKRSLLTFGKFEQEFEVTEFAIESQHHHYTDQYAALVKDFLLRFASDSETVVRE